MAFLVDKEIEFDLPGLPAATTHYTSAADAVGVALRGFQFLRWFIAQEPLGEVVEE